MTQNLTHVMSGSGSFEAFYYGTSARLLRYAYGLTGDMAEAQDFTQEAYVRAWQRWKRLREYDNPESWLRLVVTRLATDRWRWLRTRRQAASGATGLVEGPSEDLVVLVAELKRLPMPQRRALVLHYLLDRPVADIAHETGVSVNTVKSWLLRGRANLAAQLTESDAQLPGSNAQLPASNAQQAGSNAQPAPATVPAEAIVEAGRRQRRRRNTLRSIVAFLTTAAATSAYFLFAPVPEPEPTGPDLILPYQGSPRQAATMVDGQRAYVTWHDTNQQGRVAVIDLKRDKPVGPPIDLGRWDDTFTPIGFSKAGAHIIGINDSDKQDWAVFTIDPNSGKLLWQHNSNADGAGRPLVFRDAFVIVEEGATAGHITALDPGTGKPKWKIDEPVEHALHADGERVATLHPGGVLRVRDAATGRLLTERSGIPSSEWYSLVSGDFLYQSTSNGLYRAPLTGDGQRATVADLKKAIVAPCGRYICAGEEGGIEVIMLDKGSGREVRRLNARMLGTPQVSARGMILSGGTDRQFSNQSSAVFDLNGEEITPAALARGLAQWVGNDHLLLFHETEPIEISESTTSLQQFAMRTELSVYSFRTGKVTPFGEVVLRGGCGAVAGKFLCPTDTGFTLYH